MLTLCGLGISGIVSADHNWGNYHWQLTSNSLLLDLGDNVSDTWDNVSGSSWDEHLSSASSDWNVSSVLSTSIVEGSTQPRQCKAQTGNVQVCNNNYGFNGWLGIASIAISGDHITASYVKVNDSYFNTSTYNTYNWKQFVMCQEIGHTFGMGHQDENFDNTNLNSCMDYTNNPASNTEPNSHDYDLLESIYAHLDTPPAGSNGDTGGCNPRSPKCNSGATAAEILSAIEMDGPAQWGRLVSKPGLQEVYELDFGGGRKVITHVIWTLEATSKRLEKGNSHSHD